MSAWLNIIGVGEAGAETLDAAALALLQKAEIIIGVPRRLVGLDRHDKTLIEWNGSLEEMVGRILAARGAPTVLLASGDPNWFGIGATLSRHLASEEFAIHPSVSSFQLAAARLKWPMQNIATISLHGRDVALLHPHILPGNRILALTSDRQTAVDAAQILIGCGYGKSVLHLLENLGGENERISGAHADEIKVADWGDFYVLGVECVAGRGAPLLSAVPGLPDMAFENDGQLTKLEVRTSTLAQLRPYPGALLWDVGAGCGSIGIEWMRAVRDSAAIGFERDPARCAMIARNRVALGVPGLMIVEGDALASFASQPAPDAIFVGGDVGNIDLLDECWAALKDQGRLVANAVTLDGEVALARAQQLHGGSLVRIDVAVLAELGSSRAMTPRRPVTQWAVTKGAAP